METKLIIYKIESLLTKSPSVLRIGTAVWPLRIISIILAPIFTIAGLAITFFTAAILNELQKNSNGIDPKNAELLITIGFVGGVGMTIAGILFIVIVWISRLVQTRNDYISETTETLSSIIKDLTTPTV